MLCSQILVTKEDFRDKKHYLNLKNSLNGLLQNQIVPILNENDAISINTVSFTDNDELAGLAATIVNDEAVIILTSVDGLYTGNPENPTSKLIPEVDLNNTKWQEFIALVKTVLGTGGMDTKCKVAQKNARLGIYMHFINGKKFNILIDLMQKKPIGTKFLADKSLPSKKKLVANNLGFEKASVWVDDSMQKALFIKEEAKSVLPVGIVKISREFEKGDIVKIYNQDNLYRIMIIYSWKNKICNQKPFATK